MPEALLDDMFAASRSVISDAVAHLQLYQLSPRIPAGGLNLGIATTVEYQGTTMAMEKGLFDEYSRASAPLLLVSWVGALRQPATCCLVFITMKNRNGSQSQSQHPCSLSGIPSTLNPETGQCMPVFIGYLTAYQCFSTQPFWSNSVLRH